MNKYLTPTLTIINFLGLLFLAFLYFQNKKSIAYVDAPRLINEYQGMALARTEYQKKAAVWQANIDTLVREIQKDIATYEKEGAKLTSKEKELTKKLIQAKQQQLVDYQKAINEKAGQEDAASTKKVIDEINAYIKEYGEKNGFTIILSATEYGNIAFAKQHLDITEEVLRGLNSTNPSTSTK